MYTEAERAPVSLSLHPELLVRVLPSACGPCPPLKPGFLWHTAPRYLELGDSGLGLVLAGASLAVRQLGAGEAHMAIDPATAAALELIQPIRVGTCSSKLSGASLFRWALLLEGSSASL